MASASGLTNLYEFTLNDLPEDRKDSPIERISIHTNRTSPLANYIILYLQSESTAESRLTPTQQIIPEKLEQLGISHEVRILQDSPINGNKALAYIKIGSCRDARKAIDTLFSNNEMSAGNRSSIEVALRELECSVYCTSLRSDQISPAQKDIIISMITPYIDSIKEETSNSKIAQQWIKNAAITLLACQEVNKLSLSIGEEDPIFLEEKSEDFYQNLAAIARVYISMGDLERTLRQQGNQLPSTDLIQDIILDLFKDTEEAVTEPSIPTTRIGSKSHRYHPYHKKA